MIRDAMTENLRLYIGGLEMITNEVSNWRHHSHP